MFILYEGKARNDPRTVHQCGLYDTVDTEEEARKLGETTYKNTDAVWFEEVQREGMPFMQMRLDLPPFVPPPEEPTKEPVTPS